MTPIPTWTPHRVATLKELWSQGLSASAIARQLGDTTRNAVIGKLHRLQVPARARKPRAQRPRPPRPSRSPRPATPPCPPRVLAPSLANLPPLAPAPAVAPTLATLSATDCRWPEGDPKRAGFHFCGRTALADRSYCPHHQARAVARNPGDTA